MKKAYDLDRPNCHVCGSRLNRNFTTGIQICETIHCQIKGVVFHIPYIVPLIGEKK